MNDRECDELETNRRSLWAFYVTVNPPVRLTKDLSADVDLWLTKGALVNNESDVLTKSKTVMWASFRFVTTRPISLCVNTARDLDRHVDQGDLLIREAWLDSEPTDRQPTNDDSSDDH